MKNNFNLRKFLTENKNITEDKFTAAAEEDLIQCVNNLANTRYIDPVEAADEAIAIIEKTFLTNDEDEDMYEGEGLDEEVVNESIIGTIAFLLTSLAGLGGLYAVAEYIIDAAAGKHGEEKQKGAEKLYKLMDYIGRGKKK